jgi:hypothetical protein
VLNIAFSILRFMQDTFNTLTNTVEPPIKASSVLVVSIGTASGPYQIVGMVKDWCLPLPPRESLVAKEITA